MLLIKLDDLGEKLYSMKNSSFLNILKQQTNKFTDIERIDSISSISPNLATKAEFILGNRCNMRCIYCYSFDNRNNHVLQFEKAICVINRLIRNSIIKSFKLGKKKRIYLSFHGGGEPSCEFDVLEKIVEYAKQESAKYGVELFLEITTNLSQCDDRILDYYIDNRFFVHVSMDGIEFVQNFQRPMIDGSKSFNIVNRNIAYLSNHNARFSIRLTITNYSLKYALDSVKYLKSNFQNVKFIKLAPLESTVQSQQHLVCPPDVQEYIKVLEAVDDLEWSEEENYLSVFGETATLINSGLCASVRFEQLIVTPEGIITTCHEDPLSDAFKIGNITENGNLFIDGKVVDGLKKEYVDNIKYGSCNQCEFRMICMGGCKHRRSSSDREMFCTIEKYMLVKHIKRVFEHFSSLEKSDSCTINYSFEGKSSSIQIVSIGGVQ